ncbi:MAG: hypothetical protein G01um101470_1124 [Parcubacteria group bacterium Gr01-1014_70]|nr:MAG: hypothetical protein G01um101470_1124 [Parcubacteria group bacterium Gr01-1014_70]
MSCITYERTDTEIVLWVPINGFSYPESMRLSVGCRWDEKHGWVGEGMGQTKVAFGMRWSDGRFEERPPQIQFSAERRQMLAVAGEYLEMVGHYLLTDKNGDGKKDPPPTLRQWIAFKKFQKGWVDDQIADKLFFVGELEKVHRPGH